MTRFFERDLVLLKDKLRRMSSLAIDGLAAGLRSLFDADEGSTARARLQSIEEEVDALEKEIDAEAIDILLTRQPVAHDLRVITTSMKINSNLERIADEAVNIARRASAHGAAAEVPGPVDVQRLADLATSLVETSVESLFREDAALAESVIEKDAAIDRLEAQIARVLYTVMLENPSLISRCIDLLFVCRSIERIADHAKNVAEQVIYLARAVDVRHRK
jgi:phosphate transport system protein